MQFLNHSVNNWAKGLTEQASLFASVGGRSILIACLLITALLTGARKLGVLEPLELSSYDRLMRLQPDQPLDPRLLIVGMTEADIQQYGWPLSDQTLSAILERLQKHQPRVIGLDLYRSNVQTPEGSELLAQLSANNLIAIMNVGSDPDIGEVPPPPTVPWERIGFNDLVIDRDAILRRSLLYVGSPTQPYYSFSLRVALAYLAEPSLALRTDRTSLSIGGTQFRVLERESGAYQTADTRGYQILLRYRSRHIPARQLTISQVLSGRINPEWVQDKVVLIGTVAPSLKDQFYTPYSANQSSQFTMSGVVIHAQMISQILDAVEGKQALYHFWTPWGESLWLFAWTLVAGIASWKIKRPVLIFVAGGMVLLSLVGLGWLHLFHLVWIPIAEPVVGILATGGLVITQKLLYRTTHDSLTELPGREMFLQLIQRSLNTNRRTQAVHPVIVAFLDINRFKLINKSLGHSFGDRVLLALASRLKQALPASARIARVGGDEFAILFQNMPLESAGRVLDTLQHSLAEPLELDNQRLMITASVGLSITQEGYDHKPEDLLRDAHTAMYRAKSLSQFRYEVFATGLLTEAVNRLRLESDLLNALEHREFCLYYQPIVNLETGQIAGFEALVRWQQQDRGFVLPNAFIPVAEETGLILPLGKWIFQEACCQLKQWQEQFPDSALKVSVNLSGRQFSQPDLVTQIEASLQEAGINGQRIRLELTESMVMGDVQAAIDLMLRLKELGLQLSIDDFGTGYSSLSYLHRFPMDMLKVDKSFVGRMEQSAEDREIVHTIIALGHKLGMDIVAEGVETSGQMEMLKRAECQYGQGYLFSRPLSSHDATLLLMQQPRW